MLGQLLQYAEREGLAAEPGFKPKTVRWLLVFSPDGQFLGVQDLRGDDRRSRGREFTACPDLTQQEMVGVGGGCRHFLVDGVEVVALLTKDGDVNDKQSAKHAFFVDLLDQASSALPVLGRIAAALRDAGILDTVRAKLSEEKARPTDLVTLAVSDGDAPPAVIVQQNDWHAWWRSFREQLLARRRQKGPRKGCGDEAVSQMRCFLSGELVEPQRTHNKISGLSDVGGLAMGDALTSFDKDAFGSFGLAQGANSAMSEEMVKVYTTALNHLIAHRSRRLAGAKVVYWYSGRVEEDEDVLEELFAGFGQPEPDESTVRPSMASQTREQAQAESRARRLLDAIRTGERPDLAELRYHTLTLSANSGRVVIRDWMEGSFEELAESVDRWFGDLSIVSRDGKHTVRSHKFGAVLAAPVRELKDVPPALAAALWRCALRGHPIPHEIVAQTLNRVRIDLIQDESPRHARLGLLKAFCIRNRRTPNMTTELNDYETDPAYLCGRIMAILARIQRAALGDVGAGVVQRYYAAASATPALILGRLVRTAQIGHLPKIESKALQRWFDNQLRDAWNQLHQTPPATLSLEGQTLFAMGYYHQQAKRSENVTERDKPGPAEE